MSCETCGWISAPGRGVTHVGRHVQWRSYVHTNRSRLHTARTRQGGAGPPGSPRDVSGLNSRQCTMVSPVGSQRESLQRPLVVGSDSCPVRCHGVEGLLSVSDTGDVFYAPTATPPRRVCLGKQWRPTLLSGWEVVGAALDSPNSFRVWYCSQAHPGSDTAAPRFKLHKSPPFVTSSSIDAHALVQQVRAGACWWGRGTAPRAVVVINPASGQGRSAELFQRHVLPVLADAAGFHVTQLATQRPGHATSLAAELDLATVDLLLVVGGDGTVWEVLQGLLSRQDGQAAAALPLAHIPGGSGNGLAHSCGLRDPTTAAYAAVKHVTSGLDVASVLQPPGRRLYLALSLSYGLLSNLDVGTERLRWMGDLRFTLGGIKELLKGGSYHAGIAWLPGPDPAEVARARNAPTPQRFNPTPSFRANSRGALLPDAARVPAGNLETDSSRITTSSTASRSPTDKVPKAAASAAAGGSAVPGSSQQCSADPELSCTLQHFPPGPPLPLLSQWQRLPYTVPRDTKQLPPGWQSWQEPLQSLCLVNPPWISASCRMNPLGALCSGHMNLLGCAPGPGLQGRLQALQLQLAVESGAHLDSPVLLHDTVTALVFEPRDARTVAMVDGEVVGNAPLYVEVHAGLLTVLINPAHPEEPSAADSRVASQTAMAAAQGGSWWDSCWCSCLGRATRKRAQLGNHVSSHTSSRKVPQAMS